MGKVIFSVCLSVHTGGGYPTRCRWGVPWPNGGWGYPARSRWGYPRRGYPSQVCTGGGITWPGQDKGYPSQGWGIPCPGMRYPHPEMGYPLSRDGVHPIQGWVPPHPEMPPPPPGIGQQMGVLDTPRAVCHLRSRRRTFLFRKLDLMDKNVNIPYSAHFGQQ